MFGIARLLVGLELLAETGSPRTLPVKVRKAIDEIEEDFVDLEIDLPSFEVRGEDLWPAIRSLGNDTLGEWSLGRWHLPPRKGGLSSNH